MLASPFQYQPPFQVLSAHGYTLGKFDKRDDALAALRNWSQAVAAIQGDRVIARKNGDAPSSETTARPWRRAS